MRVITTFFSIESQRLVLDHHVDGAPNDSPSATANDVINAYREWLGTHEGENRVALMERSIPRHRPTHRKVHLKVVFHRSH